nr:unnamed protein product [Digitaria exilis]
MARQAGRRIQYPLHAIPQLAVWSSREQRKDGGRSGIERRSRAEGEGESQDEQGESTVEEAQSPPWRPSFCSDLSSSGSGITFSARPQSRNKGRWRRGHPAPKEHLFNKVLTPADLGSRLVIPKQDARRLRDPTGKGVVQLEDPSGKRWSFRCAYSKMGKIRRRYSLTQRWRRFVKENGLHTGDTVSFYRGVGAAGQRRLFIDWKLQSDDAGPHLRMQPPMYPCSAFSIRELSQQLAHVRATISPSSKALVSFSWLTNVRSLAGDTEDHLRDLHYRMMLAFLGVDCQKVKPNVSENSSKARSTSSSLQGASPAELTVATIAEKLKGLEIGRPELSVSATQNSTGAEAKVTMEVPVFASDDLTYVGRDRDKKLAVFGSLKLQQP